MTSQDTTTLTNGKMFQIDEARVRDHLSEIVRGSVEETLNAMLQKEADELCPRFAAAFQDRPACPRLSGKVHPCPVGC